MSTNNKFSATAGGGGGGGSGNGFTVSPGQVYTFTLGQNGWVSMYPDPIVEPAAPVEAKKVNKDGCFCKKCKEHCPYAEPNQEDGTLICYSCRNRW